MDEQETLDRKRYSFREAVLDGLVIGAVQAVVLVLILIGVTFALGNKQQKANEESVRYQSAIACELAVPSDPKTGRDPDKVAQCFLVQGLPAPTFVFGG